MTTNILLNPGPTNVADEVKNALITPNMNHREEEFTNVMHDLLNKIVLLADGEGNYDCVPFVSSGTGALEAILSTITDKDELLVLISGRYGERLHNIAETLNLNVQVLQFDPMSGIDLDTVEHALQNNPNISHMCFVHHETTTSLLSPIDELCLISEKYGVITISDTISSLLGHELSLNTTKIGYCTLTSNKCLESIPGISFVIAKKELLTSINHKSRSYYFDLHAQWNRLQNGDGLTRFTMSTQLFFAAHQAASRLLSEGVSQRAKRYQDLQTYLTEKMIGLGFTPYDFGNQKTANILKMFHLPREFSYKEFHDAVKQSGITIYTDTDTISKNLFFLATMGDLTKQSIDYFIVVTSEFMRSANVKLNS